MYSIFTASLSLLKVFVTFLCLKKSQPDFSRLTASLANHTMDLTKIDLSVAEYDGFRDAIQVCFP